MADPFDDPEFATLVTDPLRRRRETVQNKIATPSVPEWARMLYRQQAVTLQIDVSVDTLSEQLNNLQLVWTPDETRLFQQHASIEYTRFKKAYDDFMKINETYKVERANRNMEVREYNKRIQEVVDSFGALSDERLRDLLGIIEPVVSPYKLPESTTDIRAQALELQRTPAFNTDAVREVIREFDPDLSEQADERFPDAQILLRDEITRRFIVRVNDLDEERDDWRPHDDKTVAFRQHQQRLDNAERNAARLERLLLWIQGTDVDPRTYIYPEVPQRFSDDFLRKTLPAARERIAVLDSWIRRSDVLAATGITARSQPLIDDAERLIQNMLRIQETARIEKAEIEQFVALAATDRVQLLNQRIDALANNVPIIGYVLTATDIQELKQHAAAWISFRYDAATAFWDDTIPEVVAFRQWIAFESDKLPAPPRHVFTDKARAEKQSRPVLASVPGGYNDILSRAFFAARLTDDSIALQLLALYRHASTTPPFAIPGITETDIENLYTRIAASKLGIMETVDFINDRYSNAYVKSAVVLFRDAVGIVVSAATGIARSIVDSRQRVVGTVTQTPSRNDVENRAVATQPAIVLAPLPADVRRNQLIQWARSRLGLTQRPAPQPATLDDGSSDDEKAPVARSRRQR